MTLPQSTIDRIHKEAEDKYLIKIPSPLSYDDIVEENKYTFVKRRAYIEGAKSEAKRAQELVELLKELYEFQKTHTTGLQIESEILLQVKQALKNYGE